MIKMAATGRPSKLPDDSALLRDYYEEGLSHAEIAAKYGVHVSNVSRAFTRMNRGPKTTGAVQYREYLPWEIRRDHLSLLPGIMLYAHIRHARGVALSDSTMSRLRGWWKKLRTDSVVLAYSRGGPPGSEGWQYVTREETDGQLVIRWPSDVVGPSPTQKAALTLPVGDAELART